MTDPIKMAVKEACGWYGAHEADKITERAAAALAPRPISEAPKDRPILVFVPGHGWTRGIWCEDPRSSGLDCFAWSDSRLLNRMRPPTHFLEMPADPV